MGKEWKKPIEKQAPGFNMETKQRNLFRQDDYKVGGVGGLGNFNLIERKVLKMSPEDMKKYLSPDTRELAEYIQSLTLPQIPEEGLASFTSVHGLRHLLEKPEDGSRLKLSEAEKVKGRTVRRNVLKQLLDVTPQTAALIKCESNKGPEDSGVYTEPEPEEGIKTRAYTWYVKQAERLIDGKTKSNTFVEDEVDSQLSKALEKLDREARKSRTEQTSENLEGFEVITGRTSNFVTVFGDGSGSCAGKKKQRGDFYFTTGDGLVGLVCGEKVDRV